MTIKERVEAITKFAASQIVQDAALRREVSELYSLLYPSKELCSFCLGKVENALNLLRNNKNTDNMNANVKCKLVPGTQIRVHGDPKVYTDINITDRDAVALLTKMPALAKKFLVLPDMPEDFKVPEEPVTSDSGDSQKPKTSREALEADYLALTGEKAKSSWKDSTIEKKIQEKLKESEIENQLNELREQYEELTSEEPDEAWTVEQLTEKIAEEKKAIEDLTTE